MVPYQEESTSHGRPFLTFHITTRNEVVVEEFAWTTLESITWPTCFLCNYAKPDGAFYIDANSLPFTPPPGSDKPSLAERRKIMALVTTIPIHDFSSAWIGMLVTMATPLQLSRRGW